MNENIKNKTITGYTLIELILVMALIGIFFSIAMPSTNIIFRTAENNELREFKRDLIFARNSAVFENGIYSIEIDIVKNQYSIIKNKGKGSKFIKRKKFVNGIIFKNDNVDNYITFYSTGSSHKAGTIELSNSKNEKIYITITPATGKINLKYNER